MKLSIITINRNNAEGLSKTVESVAAQTYREFEHIIVDGASTDGSVAVLQDYDNRLVAKRLADKTVYPIIQWITEKDNGIYEAMNKGVRKANGEYVLMLNSGDYLVDEHVVERIIQELDGTDIVQGNNIEDKGGRQVRNRGCGKSDIDLFDVMKGHFLHQASFCRKELLEKEGYFDESYQIGGDTKFFMSALGRHDATFKYVDIDVTNYDMNGISAERIGEWAKCHQEELQRVRKEVFSQRGFAFMLDNDKKIQLYDDLHSHKWIWNLTMAVAHIYNWCYKR